MSQFMIKLIFATSICSPLWIQGSTLGDEVVQKPRDMIVNLYDSPVLQCSHSSSSYDRILWYKQTKDGQLVFLGYLVGSADQLEPEHLHSATHVVYHLYKNLLTGYIWPQNAINSHLNCIF
ncbi:hypothetical protein QQF64_011303, partial [Cirrhinus molitorella]